MVVGKPLAFRNNDDEGRLNREPYLSIDRPQRSGVWRAIREADRSPAPKMQTLQGIAVSPGVAIGEALIVDNEGFRIPRRFVVRDAVDEELGRLHKACAAVAAEIENNRDAISRQLGEQYGAIFAAHLMMLQDPGLHKEIEQLIREQHYSPEYAVSRTLRRYARVFEKLGDGTFSERAHDIFDIERSLLRQLLGPAARNSPISARRWWCWHTA